MDGSDGLILDLGLGEPRPREEAVPAGDRSSWLRDAFIQDSIKAGPPVSMGLA